MKTLMQPELPNTAVIEDCTHKTADECAGNECWLRGNLGSYCLDAYHDDEPGYHDHCDQEGWCQCTCHGTDEVITRIGHYWKDEDTDQIYLIGEAYKDGRLTVTQLVSVKTGKALTKDNAKFWRVNNKDQITEKEFRAATRGFDMTRVLI